MYKENNYQRQVTIFTVLKLVPMDKNCGKKVLMEMVQPIPVPDLPVQKN